MSEAPLLSSRNLRRVGFLLVCVWFPCLVIAANVIMAKLQAGSLPDLPFGICSSAQGAVFAQDFSYNVLYFHGIRDHLVQRPYRLEDQEGMMRQILPKITSGMSHAYSPVAFVLIQPLLYVSGQNAFWIYTSLCALGAILLYRFHLLPRAEMPLQFYSLTVCALSVWVITTFLVGQSSIMTTAFLGGFWALLLRRQNSISWSLDLGIAFFFWALCLKPSVAILPLMLLPGMKAWRPFFLGSGLLLWTWACLAGFYGGWWTGLHDYLYLLNHYANADFTSYMQRFNETAAKKSQDELIFGLDRSLLIGLSLTLLLLRWLNRISPSEQFRGMVWVFLLFSPYLLPSENWVLCLLVVEGVFFQEKNLLAGYGKLLLLAAILDLRAEINVPVQVDYPLKWLLFTWMLAEWVWQRKAVTGFASKSPSTTSS